jgi:hypothetical protein
MIYYIDYIAEINGLECGAKIKLKLMKRAITVINKYWNAKDN